MDNQEPKTKFELIRYLRQINLDDPRKDLEWGRADEIVRNVQRVMAPYLTRPEDDNQRQYYEPVIRMIERTFEERDFRRKGFPFAVRTLVNYIEGE